MELSDINNNQLDKYYTSQLTVSKIEKYLKDNITFNNEMIIEPSAGNGAFIELIKSLSSNYRFYDIKPEHKEIIQQDFLLLDDNIIKDAIIIGNPPFGRNNSLSIKFIKKCKDAKYICFILPKSFNKESMKKYFNNFENIFTTDINEDFMIGDKSININTIFMIWKKCDKKLILEKPFTNDFMFVSLKSDDYDLCIRRVGAKCGIIFKKEEFHYKTFSSFYKIKALKDVDEVVERFNEIYKTLNDIGSNSVGSKSISQSEIIKTYNNV